MRALFCMLVGMFAGHCVMVDGFSVHHTLLPHSRGSSRPPTCLKLVALSSPEIPAWGTKFETGEVITTITLSEKKPEVAVKVMNNEVSWEPWYAGLVGAGGVKNAASMAIKLSPPMGSMAPRGKEGERVRTERDDPKGNYKDFALVGVELSREGLGYLQHVKGGGKDELSLNPLYLVIKTEDKSWTYKVTLDAFN